MAITIEPPPIKVTHRRLSAAAAPAGGLSPRRNFTWTIFGNGTHAGCQWLLIAIIARLGTPEMLGAYALARSVSSPILALTGMNLRSIQATDASREFRFNSYFALRLLAAMVSVVLLAGVAVFAASDVSRMWIILVVGLVGTLDSISDIFYGLYQAGERMDCVSTSLVGKGLFSVAAFAVTILLTGNLVAAVAMVATVGILFLLLYELPKAFRILNTQLVLATQAKPTQVGWGSIAPDFERGPLTRLIWIAAPLGAATVLSSIAVNLPKYFIAYFLSEASLGYFAALVAPLLIVNLFVRSMSISAMSQLARHYISDRRAFVRCLGRCLGITCLLGLAGIIVAVFAGTHILEMIYSERFAEHAPLFAGLMATATISSLATVLAVATMAARLYHSQLLVYLVDLLVIFASCSLLIPRFELWGAVYVLAIAGLLRIAAYLWILANALRRPVLTPAPV